MEEAVFGIGIPAVEKLSFDFSQLITVPVWPVRSIVPVMFEGGEGHIVFTFVTGDALSIFTVPPTETGYTVTKIV